MMIPIYLPETSVRNHHHSLRNRPEERGTQQLSGESLKLRKAEEDFVYNGNKKQAGNGQRPSGMQEDRAGSRSLQLTAATQEQAVEEHEDGEEEEEEEQSTLIRQIPTYVR